MPKPKPVNPYTELKRDASEWIRKFITRKRVRMWNYPKGEIGKQWSLADLAERVQAAHQLGWDVQVKWTEEGLAVEYVQRVEGTPYWY